MRDSAIKNSYIKHLFSEFSNTNQENSPCHAIENVSIIVNKKRWKKRKNNNLLEHAQQPSIAFRLSRHKQTHRKPNKQGIITRNSSMPELSKCTRPVPPQNRSDRGNDTKQSLFQSKFIANVVSEHRFDNWFFNSLSYPSQTKWKIYRCQLGAVEDSCCCSCNSDAMFEVMKGLYDCYKAKNCDVCDCVLCGYKTREEKKLDELKKSMTSTAREKVLDGKTPAEKEFILKDMAQTGVPIPSGKTASEKALINKVRKELGLPPSPKNASEKSKMRKAEAAGIIIPLEGKSPEEKERILKAQADMGLSLPEGRTDSEKALIEKIKKGKKGSMKAAALLTPLTGKTPEEKEKILRGRAMKGLPLPEATTASEKKIIDKVRVELGLPMEPTTKSMKAKFEQAAKAGLLQPLEGKTPEEKEKTLKGLHDLEIPLPEGRTPSEKALIAMVKSLPRAGSIKTAGVMTPITGKSLEQKEKILRKRAMKGISLPEGQSPSEKKLLDKVRADLGLPKEPDTKSMKKKHEQAARAGLLEPLEGKTAAQKEQQLKGLRDMGIPLPEGRTPSEKALIAKVKASPRSIVAFSEQMRRAKAEGLLTPLTGKTPAQKEKILKGLAMKGIPLPEGKTASEKKIIDKVRDDLGLPKAPDTKSMKEKHDKAAKAGLLQPLIGKTPEEKEKILQGQYDLGIPLPEGRTPSEKALIFKIKALPPGSIKTAGVMTPLAGKPPAFKEKVLRARAKKGIPLPEGGTPSEKKLIEKVRADLGLPKEPDTKSMKKKHEQAAKAGLLEPLEGKTAAQKEQQLKGLRDMGIPLPEGRTPSEKALIAKIKVAPRSIVAPAEQMRRAKAEGLLTPLTGKTPAQKEKILKGLAMKGIPLPEGKTASEKKIIDKVRDDLGLPKEPDTKSMKEKHEKAAKAGLLQPLLGKTPEEKERILQGQFDLGIPLPEGRTPSEKALIAKIKALPPVSIKTAGVMTPLTGKPAAIKEKVLRARAMKGIPLPEGETPSEKIIIDKVRADLGLPKEPDTKSMKKKHEQAARAGLLEPLEGKTAAQKEQQLKGLRDMGIPLPEGRTPSEKALIAKIKAAPRSIVAPSEHMRRAKAEGLLTPLTGKTPAQKEKILKGLAMEGIPLPEGKTASEKKIIDKVRDDLGLPKEPDSKSMKEKHAKAAKAGLLQPLVGKTPEEKEKILQGQYDLGIPLHEGRTPSEKALIAKIKAIPPVSIKTAGVMTPLAGKLAAVKEKVLRARAMKGIPLPEGETPSEKKIINKVRAELGLPKEPDTKSMKKKHEQAARAGLLEPLEGKTAAQKEQQLKGLRDMGIPLPEGRTPSEKALIAKIKAAPRSIVAPSEQMRRAKAEGLLTPLTGKTPAQKEKILKGLAMKGIPLPEGKTASEKKIIDKVRDDVGLPKEPDTKSMKEKHEKAAKAGLLQPLIGKTPEEKERILQGQYDLGIPLPGGRTSSEKALIAKIKALPPGSIKTAGVMTPLAGKPPAVKDKVLRARAMKGIPLPVGETPSEKKIIEKVRADLGLPKEPDTKSMKKKHEKAARAGLLEPLEGKTAAQKEQQLKGLRDMGIPLPVGRTPSEKALIAKVQASPRSIVAPSEQMRRAKAEGLLTPLTGKTPAQKEKILKGLAMKGIPLPEGKTASEKKIIDKVRDDVGLPKEPDTKSMKKKHEKAAKAGLLQPLVGKTPEEKERILQGQYDLGIPLPEGRTPSEKALIAKIKALPPVSIKTAGVMTPLAGKPAAIKEKVLRARAMKGIPLPEGETPSEKKIIEKVRADLGLPKEPDTKSMKKKHEQAARDGLLEPLEGKTAAQKEQQLKGLRDMGIPLPEGRTPSEKALIAKIKAAPRSIVAPSEQMRRAKAEGLLTPLTGKTPAQKEKILKGLAMKGIPLPEGKTASEKKIIDKVRDDLGLPKEPDTKSMKDKHDKAAKAGLLQPLVGKTPEEKEKILQGQYDLGIPLHEGRTPSEKALIAKIKALPPVSIKTAGVMTPLAGKPAAIKEKVLRARAMKGIPLPEGETPSEKKIIDKVRANLGLPKEPDTKSMKKKHEQAARAGLLEPLEGKTAAQKEQQLKGLRDMGIPLPEGRTPSEKALIAKIKAAPRSIVAPSEHMRRAKAEGLLTPLTGKTPAQKEKILKGLAMKGIPLPEGKTGSEKKIIDKVREDLGLPKEPDTKSMRDKHEQAAKAGLLQPLVGKTPEEKEKIVKGLRDYGIPLPEGKTPSEKALVAKVKAAPRSVVAPSELMRRAKAEGLLTPLKGKTPEQKEKILKGLAMKGLLLPEPQTPSEKKLADKVRADLGLPKEPSTKSLKEKHEKAAKAGLLQPLEGMTPEEKEKTLKFLHDLGIPLPEGRTPSEKSLIAKIKALPLGSIKTAGLMTPLAGKPPAFKEKVLKARAMKGIPLPEGETPSEKKLVDKVRADLGLPKEPETKSMKDKHKRAAQAGLLEPLEGKTPAQKEQQLKGLRDMGIPLPEGRTPSEKALIAKVKASPRSVVSPSEQMRRAKAEGLLTPLTGKTPAQKEKILKGLAMKGIPLPEGETPSEKKLVDKVRADLGLPKEPDTKSMRDKHEQAAKAGLLQPLVGKTPEEKEKILKGLRDYGIPLPEGRTPSEIALIAKVKAAPRSIVAPSEQMRRAKAEGLLTPLKDKTPEQKEKILKGLAMKGLLLPEPQTPSEKILADKVRADLGLPIEPTTKSLKEKHEKAAKAGLLRPLEGLTPEEKEKTLKRLQDLGIPLPEGRTPSEKALISKVKSLPREATIKTADVMMPLAGNSPEQKDKILRARAMKGIPLPEGETPSEKKLVDKVRADLGLPKEPDTKSMKDKHEQAAKAGLLEPLEGKTPAQKEQQLKGLRDMGIPLPEGRTPSEKALIAKIKAAPRSIVAPSEHMRRAKAEGLLTPLTGKTPAQKEKILKGLAMRGIPLPEGKTPSEKKIIDKVRTDLGLPKEPDTKSMRDKHEQAAKAGLLQPLVGKTPEEKEKILKGLRDYGIPLPEGRTPSEIALIAKVKAAPRSIVAPSEQMRRAKAEGLLTPLKDKTPEQKEKILKGLAMKGLLLPEPQTPSEKILADKVRADLGLPIEPTTKSLKEKHEKAAKAGLLRPLEGLTPEEKEKTLKRLQDLGIPLPEGRTPSEKALISKVKSLPREATIKTADVMMPLAGKSPEQKDKILRARAMKGIPLPEGETPSEKKLVDKVRADLGLPKEPDTKSMKDKHEQAAKAGLLEPLEGKTPAQKEQQLKGLRDMGIPLPEGRTPSEKALIAKVKASPRSIVTPSEQMRRAEVEGLLTPLTGKTPVQKEKILKGLAMKGIPLPEGKTPSEKKIIDKVRDDLGLPNEPTTKSLKEKHEKAAKAGLLRPMEGLTPEEKEKTLKGLQDLGIPLPEGRTPSEKALIAKVKASAKEPTITSDKLRKAKAAGLLTPLAGKTPEQKEKILQGLAQIGLPLPEGKTPSDKALVNKVKNEFGIPERTLSEKMRKAKTTGLLTPLEGKTPEQKEKILRGRAAAGLPLPMAKTPSERALIKKIKDETGYVTPAPSEGLRRAKAAGLLTPLEGKTPAQKKKILKGLAEAGLPLPEGKTKSERSMISKIKAQTPALGITPSEKSIIGKAKAAGLFTPISGKSPAEKERILKGLAEAGLPLPEGKTASEKDLVKKIRAEAGLPPEPTPSEKKGKIRKKEKKVGIYASKKARGIDAEEFEDIIKTTTCDRGCGCDKKKIRFKHSYVKIRVTSPDISSFCDCPDECLPGVKSGAFIDNDGIKVTVGSAVGIPSYSMVCMNQVMPGEIISITDLSKTHTKYYNIVDVFKQSKYMLSSLEPGLNINNSNKKNDKLNFSNPDISYKEPYNIQSENSHEHSIIAHYQGRISKSERTVESLTELQSLDDIYKERITKSKSSSSIDTILIISNEMSLSTSASNSIDTISLTSVMLTSVTSSSALYSGYQSTNDLLSSTTVSLDGLTTSDDFIKYSAMRERGEIRNIEAAIPQRYTIMRMSELEDNFGNKNLKESMKDPETEDPIVLFNQLPSKLDVSKTIFKIMSKKRFSTASSVFIVVPMSEDKEEHVPSNCVDSTTSMGSSECDFTANTTNHVDPDYKTYGDASLVHGGHPTERFGNTFIMRTAREWHALPESVVPDSYDLRVFKSRVNRIFPEKRATLSTTSLLTIRSGAETKSGGEQVCGKGKKFYLRKIKSINDKEVMLQNETIHVLRRIQMIQYEVYRISRPNEKAEMLENAVQGVATDTTAGRPCCSSKEIVENVLSRQVTPFTLKGKSFSWFHLPGMRKVFAVSEKSTGDPSSPCHHQPLVKKVRSLKVQKPSIESINQEGEITPSITGVSVSWSHLPCKRDGPAASDTSTRDLKSLCHKQSLLKRVRSLKVQKPSIESINHEGETTPKMTVSAVSKWSSRSWSRLSSQFKDFFRWPDLARSTSACGVSQYVDSSYSHVPSDHPHHYSRHQQNQTSASLTPCVSSPGPRKVKSTQSAKVPKPSIESIYHESETTPKLTGITSSWLYLHNFKQKDSRKIHCQCPKEETMPQLALTPSHLMSLKSSDQEKREIAYEYKEDNLMSPTYTKGTKFIKKNEGQIVCRWKEDKPTFNLKQDYFPDIRCPCDPLPQLELKDERMQQKLANSNTVEQKEDEIVCDCKENKPISPKHLKSTKSSNQEKREVALKSKEDKLMRPTDSKGPKFVKKKEGEIFCGCKENKTKQNTMTLSDSKSKPDDQLLSGQISQPLERPLIKQKDSRVIRWPFRKHDPMLQPEPLKIINLKDSPRICCPCPKQGLTGPQLALAKDITPVQQKLATRNTVEQKEKQTLCKCKENKPISPKTSNLENREVASKCKEDKLMSPMNPKCPKHVEKKEVEVDCGCKKDKLKLNIVTLSDSKSEPGGQVMSGRIPQPLERLPIKQKDTRGTRWPFRKHDPMPQTESAKEITPVQQNLAKSESVDQKKEEIVCKCKGNKPIGPKTSKLENREVACKCKEDKQMSHRHPNCPKFVKKKEGELVCRCKDDKTKQNTVTLSDSKSEPGGQLMSGQISQPLERPPIKQNNSRGIRWPFRKYDPMLQPELLKIINQKDSPRICCSFPIQGLTGPQLALAKDITPVQQKLATRYTVEQKEKQIVCKCKENKPISPKTSKLENREVASKCKEDKLMSPMDPKCPKFVKKKEVEVDCGCKEDKHKLNTVTLSDSKSEPGGQLMSGRIPQPIERLPTKQKDARGVRWPFRKHDSMPQPKLGKEITPVQQKLAKSNSVELDEEQIGCKCKETKPVIPREPNGLKFVKKKEVEIVCGCKEDKLLKRNYSQTTCCPCPKQVAMPQPESAKEITPENQKLANFKTAKQENIIIKLKQFFPKGKKFYLQEKSGIKDTEVMFQNESVHVLRRIEMMKDEFREISTPNKKAEMLEKAVERRNKRKIKEVGIDTTAGKSLSWFHLPGMRNAFAASNVSPSHDFSFNPVSSNYSHHHGPGQQFHNKKNPAVDLKVSRNLSANIQKPSIESTCHEGATVLKTAVSAVSKCRSWSRLSSQFKDFFRWPDLARSTSTCGVSQYVDSSYSHVASDHPRHYGRHQQNQTSASLTPCVSLPGHGNVKRTRTVKVQKPSLESIYHENETTPKLTVSAMSKCRSWSRVSSQFKDFFRWPDLARSTSTCGVSQYVDSSYSHVTSDHPRHYGRHQQNQTSASLTPCVSSPGHGKMKRTRTAKVQKPSLESIYHENETTPKLTGLTLSWSGLPSKSMASEPSEPTWAVPQYLNSSSSPATPDHPHHHDYNKQSQMLELRTYPPNVLNVNRTRTAKVQKPSIESIYHEGETTSEIIDVTLIWSRLPCKLHTSSSTSITKCADLECSNFPHGHSEQSQTSELLRDYPSDDMRVTRHPADKVQTSSVESILREDGTVSKQNGIIAGRFCLPDMSEAPAKFRDTHKVPENPKPSKPKSNTIALSVSKPEPGSQLMSTQIFQLQQISLIKQNDFQEIHCPCTKQDPMLQPVLVKEITPVHQQLTNSNTVEQKEEDIESTCKKIKPISSVYLKSPKSTTNNQEKKEVVCEYKDDKLMSPRDPEGPIFIKKMDEEKPKHNFKQKHSRELSCSYPKQDPMTQPKFAKEMTPVQQILANSNTVERNKEEIVYKCKEIKTISPKLLKSRKSSSQEKREVACECKEDKVIIPREPKGPTFIKDMDGKTVCECKVQKPNFKQKQSRELSCPCAKQNPMPQQKFAKEMTPVQHKLANSNTVEQNEEEIVCKCKENKPISSKLMKSPKSTNQEKREVACECKEDKVISPREPKGPTFIKKMDGETVCGCKEEKPKLNFKQKHSRELSCACPKQDPMEQPKFTKKMSPVHQKLANSNTVEQNEEEIVCECKENIPISSQLLKSPKSSNQVKREVACECKEDKVISPREPKGPTFIKKLDGDTVCECKEENPKHNFKQKHSRDLSCPCPKQDPMTQPKFAKEMTPVQQKFANSNTVEQNKEEIVCKCKENKPISPKLMKSPKSSNQEKREVACECKEDKVISPRVQKGPTFIKKVDGETVCECKGEKPKLHFNLKHSQDLSCPCPKQDPMTQLKPAKEMTPVQQKLENSNTVEQNEEEIVCKCKENKPIIPKLLKSPKSSNQEKREVACECKEDKAISTREPNGPKFIKKVDGETVCECKEEKPKLNFKQKHSRELSCPCPKQDPKTHSKFAKEMTLVQHKIANSNTVERNEEEIVCKCKENKPLIPKLLKSPKSSNQEKREVACECKKDKAISPREPNDPIFIKKVDGETVCECKEEKPKLNFKQKHSRELSCPCSKQDPKTHSKFAKEMTPVQHKLANSNTVEWNEEEIVCKCKENKPISPKLLKSPISSNQEKKEVACECKEDKVISPREPKGPTFIKKMDGETFCECKDQKPKPNFKQKHSRGLSCPCPKQDPMTQPKNAKEMTPVQQKLANSNTVEQNEEEIVCKCKKNKPISPNLLKSPKSSNQEKKEVACECKEDKVISPREPKGPTFIKKMDGETFCECKDQKPKPNFKQKHSRELSCPCPKQDPMTQPKFAKEMTPVQKKLANSNTVEQNEEEIVCKCKENKPISPKLLKSPKSSNQEKKEVACKCKEDKVISPREPKGPTFIKKVDGETVCECKEEKPKFNFKQKHSRELNCPCPKQEPMTQPEFAKRMTPVRQKLANSNTVKQKEEEIECTCKDNKIISPKLRKSHKTSTLEKREVACECKEQKLISPRDPKRPKIIKKKEEEMVSKCKKDKPVSLKRLKRVKSSNPEKREVACECKEDNWSCLNPQTNSSSFLMNLGPFGSLGLKFIRKKEVQLVCGCPPIKNKESRGIRWPFRKHDPTLHLPLAIEITPGQQKLANPKTVEQKDEKMVYKCNDNNTISPDHLENPQTSKKKERDIVLEYNEDKPMNPEYQKRPKTTSKQQERETEWECKEDIPIISKDRKSPKNSKQRAEIDIYKCKEVTRKCEKHEPKKETVTEKLLTRPRPKRCLPRLPPVILGLPPVETPEGYLYEGIGPSCKWLDTGEIKRIRSDLTQSTSGFKACKMKKLLESQVLKSDDDIELDFGDAIRYFASMNPVRCQQLMQEELESQLMAENYMRKEKKMETARKKSEKVAKKGKIQKTTSKDEFSTSDESASDHPQGFKFSIAVKNGPTGLAGVDYSKMNR